MQMSARVAFQTFSILKFFATQNTGTLPRYFIPFTRGTRWWTGKIRGMFGRGLWRTVCGKLFLLLSTDGFDILFLHHLVKKFNRAALYLAVRNSNLAEMGTSVTRQAFSCLVPATTKLANMNLIIVVRSYNIERKKNKQTDKTQSQLQTVKKNVTLKYVT